MNTIKSMLESAVESAAQVLSELKKGGKSSAQLEQLEFSFGIVREFEVNQSVHRKLAKR